MLRFSVRVWKDHVHDDNDHFAILGRGTPSKSDILWVTFTQGGAWQHFWPLAAPLISAKVSRTAAIRTPKATISSLARRSYPV